MFDPLTNPPVPDWNELSNQEKSKIDEAWEIHSCPHSCGGDVLYLYNAIRDVLKERERRVLRATMDGPPAEHFA